MRIKGRHSQVWLDVVHNAWEEYLGTNFLRTKNNCERRKLDSRKCTIICKSFLTQYCNLQLQVDLKVGLNVDVDMAVRQKHNNELRAGSHGAQVPSHLRSICAISAIESMEVGSYHFTWIFESWVSSMTWMSTWRHFSRARLGTSVESWVEQKARPRS